MQKNLRFTPLRPRCADVGKSDLEAMQPLLWRTRGDGPGDVAIESAGAHTSRPGRRSSARAPGWRLRRLTWRICIVDPESGKAGMTAREYPILPVHMYGQPADMNPINEIAWPHKSRGSEDAAQLDGSHCKEEIGGALGDATWLSPYATRVLGALLRAGAGVTDGAALANKVQVLANCGSRVKYENEVKGFNSRLTSCRQRFFGSSSGILMRGMTGAVRWQRDTWRRALLILQARMHGGSILMGSNLSIERRTRFQGLGTLISGDQVTVGYGMAGSKGHVVLLQPRHKESKITIGSGSTIVSGTEIIARDSISIGSNCRVGSEVPIYDSDFHGIEPHLRNKPSLSAPVVIEDNVWIGNRVIILKGVHIGRDSVIGAGCAVTKDVAQGSVVVGNPMKSVGTVYA